MSNYSGLVLLLTSVSLLALGWLALLPWIAERPSMKSHLNWLDEQRIDPSAMYYTELDAMDDILHRLRWLSRDPAVERAIR